MITKSLTFNKGVKWQF